jgi:hypothetical protein
VLRVAQEGEVDRGVGDEQARLDRALGLLGPLRREEFSTILRQSAR